MIGGVISRPGLILALATVPFAALAALLALSVTGPAVGVAIPAFGMSFAFLIGAVAPGLALCLLPSIEPGRAV